jgi:hypothetical protein
VIGGVDASAGIGRPSGVIIDAVTTAPSPTT